ncbi:MAG TPA: carboxylesterase family protein, partial [Streptosporangiaceae bacterium]
MVTESGLVAGRACGGAMAFLGLRYGAPTWGEGRFLAPARPQPWSGTREATEFGPACPPTLTAAERAAFERSALWRSYAGVDSQASFSEDCLSVNIWTRDLSAGRRAPVFVWLHGGGFAWGSGSTELTAGDVLASRHDAVVVTVNHRLGVLGYLQVPSDSFEESGVAGLLDLRSALEWIRDNIEAFGGDPA